MKPSQQLSQMMISKISDFLEQLEAHTTDKNTGSQIREFMTKENLWQIPTPPQEIPEEQEVEDTQIVYNAVKCLVCGTTITSNHVHDYKTCGCENKAMVDGGLDYARYGAVDINKIIKLTYTMDDPHDLIREFFGWGSFGKDGKQPITFKKLKDMSDDHIRAVIVYKGVRSWVIELMKQEIDYREEFNISITD